MWTSPPSILSQRAAVWHRREHGQLLQIVSGYGFVCKEAEAPQEVHAGDTVRNAPTERHWHGASSGTLMSHTTITIGTTELDEAVTEAAYAAAHANSRRLANYGGEMTRQNSGLPELAGQVPV